MNSRLMIYLGHQVRTLLIISQVIADAKLYLKYPSESAQLITTVVPEHINDYVINAFQNLPKRSSVPPSPSSRAHHAHTTTNLQEEIARSNLNHVRSSENINIQPVEPSMSQHRAGLGVNRWNSRLWTWFQSSLKKASFHDGPERSFSTTDPRESTPVAPHSQTSDLTATNPIASSDVSHSKDRQPSINIDEHLEKLKASRMHIGPMTIVTTLILSKFDYLTYMALIVNFLASGAALIWLPLLASIYFWAMLTFPYPSRHFWHVITFSCMLILLIQ